MFTKFSGRQLHVLAVIACFNLVCSLALADAYRWDNLNGGVFNKPDNWNPTGIPGLADTAIFDLNTGTYNVTVTWRPTISRLRLDSGTVSLDIAESLTATNANGSVMVGWSVDEVADVTLNSGVLNSDSLLAIGPYIGATGIFTIASGLVTSGEFDVGHKGAGSLLIQSGGNVDTNGQVIIASFSNSVGDATVDGGRWDYSGNFTVGWDGVGELTARNGAEIIESTPARVVYIGRTETSSGTVLIEGDDTAWQTNGGIRVGNYGVGNLTIRDSATVSGTNAFLGNGATGSGTVLVDGGNWDLSGDLYIAGTTSAGSGQGLMTIKTGSQVTVGGQTKLWNDGLLLLKGGKLSTGSLRTGLGTFGWSGGELQVTGSGGLKVGPSRHVESITLTSGKTLTVDHALTVYNGGAVSLSGGTISCGELELAGGSFIAQNGINLDLTNGLNGFGYLNGSVSGSGTNQITAAGALTMGDPASINGYDFAGTLAVGGNQVTLLDANRARLGSATTISDGGKLIGINGLMLDAGQTLTATGSALIQGNFLNDGIIDGPAASEYLTFDDTVSGAGTFSGNIEFLQGYEPGNSAASISFGDGNVNFGDNSVLTMEILGLSAGDQYDRLTDIGLLDFQGKLKLVFGFTPEIGNTFNLFGFSGFSGSLDNFEVIGLDSALLDTSGLKTVGTLTVVPEPASMSMLLIGTLMLFRRKRVA